MERTCSRVEGITLRLVEQSELLQPGDHSVPAPLGREVVLLQLLPQLLVGHDAEYDLREAREGPFSAVVCPRVGQSWGGFASGLGGGVGGCGWDGGGRSGWEGAGQAEVKVRVDAEVVYLCTTYWA